MQPHHHYNQGRKDRMVGTPSAPNRKLLDRTPYDPRPFPRRAPDRQEQIPTDRQPTRRETNNHLKAAQISNTAAVAEGRGAWTDNQNNAAGRAVQTAPNAIAAGLPRFREMEARAAGQGHGLQQASQTWKPSLADLQVKPQVPTLSSGKANTARANQPPASLAGEPPSKIKSPIWTALDQALRATDLLLAAGGFSTIVLDLGGTPPEYAWRIPLATWFRFRAGADRARTVLLVLTQHPCARSSAELVLRMSAIEPQAATTVLTGAHFRVTIDRRRFETIEPAQLPSIVPANPGKLHLVQTRKQPQPERGTQWRRSTAWTGAAQ
jgi:recombination protein RecA